jgi:hypothetical protein
MTHIIYSFALLAPSGHYLLYVYLGIVVIYIRSDKTLRSTKCTVRAFLFVSGFERRGQIAFLRRFAIVVTSIKIITLILLQDIFGFRWRNSRYSRDWLYNGWLLIDIYRHSHVILDVVPYIINALNA